MKIHGQRLLIVETITWKPHIETAMEIALCAQDNGQEVRYLNIRRGLPVVEDRLPVHTLYDLPRKRIGRARKLLAKRGVQMPDGSISADHRRRRSAQAVRMLAGCTTLEDVTRLSLEEFPDIGWGVASSAISMLRDPYVTPSRHRRLLVNLLAASLLVFDKTIEAIRDLQPEVVVLFNGRFATTRAVQRAADSCGVRWTAHERGCDKNHYWLATGQIHNPEYFQKCIREAWSPDKQQAGHDFYRHRRGRIERDWHSYTSSQTSGRLPAQLRDDRRRWIVYFSSSEDEYAAIGDTYFNPSFPTQGDAIRALAETVNAMPGYALCVRVHPHIARKSEKEQEYWRSLQLPGNLVVGPDEDIDSYALLEHAHAVCTYGSTVGVEATYWGKPSMLLGRAIYDVLDVCCCPTSREEIRAFLENPTVFPMEGALMYGAFSESFGIPYRYYQAENLHRGRMLGVDLDDGFDTRILRSLARLFHIRRFQNAAVT